MSVGTECSEHPACQLVLSCGSSLPAASSTLCKNLRISPAAFLPTNSIFHPCSCSLLSQFPAPLISGPTFTYCQPQFPTKQTHQRGSCQKDKGGTFLLGKAYSHVIFRRQVCCLLSPYGGNGVIRLLDVKYGSTRSNSYSDCYLDLFQVDNLNPTHKLK